MTKIFLDDSWQEYDYNTLYNTRGFTNTVSTNIIVYDQYHTLLEAWYNSGFNWIEQDHRWYPVLSTPYYVRTSDKQILYRIEEKLEYPVYINNGTRFILYEGTFTTPQILHDFYGITETPSTVWDIDEGEPWAWYNSDENQYWNNKTHSWTTVPPEPGHEDEEPEILPNPIPLVEFDSFDNLQDPIILAGLETYRKDYEYKTWTQGKLLEPVDIGTFNVLEPIYPDILDLDISLYVIDPDGLDFGGTHYNYSDEIVGIDKITVMSDSQGEDVFYYGQDQYKFYYRYDSLDPNLKHYWFEDEGRYYTQAELFNMGYTMFPTTITYFTDNSSVVGTVIKGVYDSNYGYFCDGVWYPDVSSLNTAGYYVIEKITKTVYRDVSSKWYYNNRIVNTSTSFSTGSSYRRALYEDPERSTPFLWDGNTWKWDLELTIIPFSNSGCYTDISNMPSSTNSSDYATSAYLFSVITSSGTPRNPLVNGQENTRLYVHICTNYYYSLYVGSDQLLSMTLYYWRFV